MKNRRKLYLVVMLLAQAFMTGFITWAVLLAPTHHWFVKGCAILWALSAGSLMVGVLHQRQVQ